jgi:hypothetical protein
MVCSIMEDFVSDKWMTLAAAAATINVHPRTIERRIASGKIQTRRADDGQLQVLINAPDSNQSCSDPLETVKELAQDQVSLATGSASALVKFAQDDANRAWQELEVARRDARRVGQGAKLAWSAVALMSAAICVAVGWTSYRIAKSSEQLRALEQQSAQVRAAAEKLLLERDKAVADTQAARIAKAQAEGQLVAYVQLSGKRPTTRPANVIQRITAVFSGD